MILRRSVPLVALATLPLVTLAACGGGGGGAKSCPPKVDTKTATGGAISVCASDLKFDVNTIKASPGVLKVTLTDGGVMYHTFRIQNTPLELKTNPGKTATGTVTLAKGTYVFDCSVPGHAQAGMKGKIEVG